VDDDKKEIDSKSFNIGYFALIFVKKLLSFFKFEPDWPKIQTYIDSSE
jgi:hypothetical protein